MTATTTICLDPKVKDKLASLKHHPRESFSSVVERLANLAIDEEPLSDEAIQGIEEALVDIKHGRLHSEEEIMKEFDLK
jgi:predicted transcriptional regulator